MKLITRVVLGVVGVLIAATVYNFDAISGQWKFDNLCKSSGGSKFYAKVEQDVGWEVDAKNEQAYKVPFGIGRVVFVRFRDKYGDLLDVHLKPGPTPWSKGYEITKADPTKQPRYRLTSELGLLPDDMRIGRVYYAITDVQRGSLVATHTYFNYSWTKPERVVLSAPTSVSCHAGQEVDLFFSRIFESRKN